jgi:tRNA pseudouridine38-40 synthase
MRRRRLALWMWYRGERFNGWQSQGDGRSVQDALGAALRPLGVTSRPMASGRTDRGVHARCQPVSVRVPEEVPLSELTTLGETDWGVALAVAAPEGFHAQWSSMWKEYRYRLALGPTPSGWTGLTWELPADEVFDTSQGPDVLRDFGRGGGRFDIGVFQAALHRAEGSRHFGAFQARSSTRRMRTLFGTRVLRADNLLEVRLRADGFGRFGVRLLVGGAMLVATGQLDWPQWEAALDSGAPIRGLRAPAAGLTLWAVGYPENVDPFAQAAVRVPERPPFIPLDQE